MANSKLNESSDVVPKEASETYWPVIAGWSVVMNGRDFSRLLLVARKKQRRSYLGIPIADPLGYFANTWGTIATFTDLYDKHTISTIY